ncbi:MAG: hypothetical protein PHH26_06145 [Candidatus Thermoplasmatota archaeon]|nr:hypothetical protein [Candidatus Thermoplasmatota archaeon]
MARRQKGNCAQVQVFEAVIIAIMMIMAVAFVASFSLPSSRQQFSIEQLKMLAKGKLQNLYNLPLNSSADRQSYDNHLLLKYITEGVAGNPKNMTDNINATLPGVYYNVYLYNGYDQYPVYVQGNPPSSAISVEQAITAPWSYTAVFTDLDVYGITNSTPMTVWAMPVYKSSLVKGLSSGVPVIFSNGNAHTLSEKVAMPGLYEKTSIPPKDVLHPTGYATSLSSSVKSNITYNGVPLSGQANYSAIAGGGLIYRVANLLHSTAHITLNNRSMTIGNTLQVSYDFSGITGSGVTFQNVDIVIYGPILNHRENANTNNQSTGTYSYTVPKNALFGPYCVVAEAYFLVQGVPVNARLVDYYVVTLPDGSQPMSPAYKVQMIMWYPEW